MASTHGTINLANVARSPPRDREDALFLRAASKNLAAPTLFSLASACDKSPELSQLDNAKTLNGGSGIGHMIT
eukprot:CAMPEP_0179607448 /NCGR_PEP_ID=MMETSP0930-20121108/1941_1 /TAXON_ID=548131 ORGANISM="Ostreococcus mediterraneus, Strain clade-D-RCC1621" /NCGR_SAMPLE_ID=MMETSP0930 /ASSEMBLY_ACC=CAM_ASM_000580 /LENGTH=72 /DNA_ID=CAMNT_0021475907 /DNA_START=1365 /DNA_END=1583 /DNA_ORIENTATION=+